MAHSSWGPGWPNCQRDKINTKFFSDTRWGRVSFPGGVRHEICELVDRLVKETANRGYRFGVPGNPSYGCWGYNCRSIRGSDEASNHSLGLSIDINAPKNPMGSRLITDMPGWMPDLWNAYGFRWGGDYRNRPDAMHYEFMGSVADAARYTAIARRNNLGGAGAVKTSPTPEDKPAKRKDLKMLFLIKGDKTNEWWLTDMMTKRHIETATAGPGEKVGDRDFFLYTYRANGGTVVDNGKGGPQVWEQEKVDDIPVLPKR